MKISVFLIVAALLVAGCSGSDYAPVGELVFADDNAVYHTNSSCHNLTNGKDMNGHPIYAMNPCDTFVFIFKDYERVCSNCVSAEEFLHLKSISEHNKRYKANRQWLYDKMVRANYFSGSYDTFVRELSNQGVRLISYNKALELGLAVGTYAEFTQMLGYYE